MTVVALPSERVVSSAVALFIAFAAIAALGWMARASRRQQLMLACVIAVLGMTMSAAAVCGNRHGGAILII